MKMTPKRIEALKYAAGQSAIYPRVGISRALEKAGLIRWVGSFGVGFGRVQNENCKQPWIITEVGMQALNQVSQL